MYGFKIILTKTVSPTLTMTHMTVLFTLRRSHLTLTKTISLLLSLRHSPLTLTKQVSSYSQYDISSYFY